MEKAMDFPQTGIRALGFKAQGVPQNLGHTITFWSRREGRYLTQAIHSLPILPLSSNFHSSHSCVFLIKLVNWIRLVLRSCLSFSCIVLTLLWRDLLLPFLQQVYWEVCQLCFLGHCKNQLIILTQEIPLGTEIIRRQSFNYERAPPPYVVTLSCY